MSGSGSSSRVSSGGIAEGERTYPWRDSPESRPIRSCHYLRLVDCVTATNDKQPEITQYLLAISVRPHASVCARSPAPSENLFISGLLRPPNSVTVLMEGAPHEVFVRDNSECNGDVTTVTLPLGPKSYRLILRELVRKVYSRCRLSSHKGDSRLETCQRRLLRSQVL